MRWQGRRESDNVEDRRGVGVPFGMNRGGLGGLGGRMGRAGRAGGIGGIGLIIIVLVSLIFGIDPTMLLQGGPAGGNVSPFNPPAPANGTRSPTQDEMGRFVKVVLADTEDTWKQVFGEQGRSYQEPTLVLFEDAVDSACGYASAAMGPFYCPRDSKVYLDLSFFRELSSRFGAPGDFAEAYVIAHEVGHHVQNQLGISAKVDQLRRQISREEANQLSVMVELQADCLAGVWAHHANASHQLLEPGDIDEALKAASAIGDDRLQRQSQGYVVPDSFTHGSSAQRVRWFKTGFQSGRMDSCDTFSADRL